MKNIISQKKPNKLKGHLLFLVIDSLSAISYFAFDAISEIDISINNLSPEIVVNEVDFYLLVALLIPTVHFLIILDLHTPLSKKSYKEKFNAAYLAITLGIAVFSGYFASIYVENKLESNEYHFCENLSYEKTVRGATHYVWRAKEISCE